MISNQWLRLDTAAKIYPPSTSKRNSQVFRLVCELDSEVAPEILQNALKTSLEQFPFYRFILRRGFFWYYLEKTDLEPLVREECATPCASLYDANRKNLLFELTYYRKRINLETYHALTDGMGASAFLKAIVFHYLMEKHRDTLDSHIRLNDADSPSDQKFVDAFDTYYSTQKTQKNAEHEKSGRAYRGGGERYPESRLGIIEGHISAAALLKKSHELDATLSELLVSLLIWSIHDGMKVRDEELPVSITVPVNLRKYFPTSSGRNFISVVNAVHRFSKQGKTFDAVLAGVKLAFKAQLTAEKLFQWLNQHAGLDHALYLKIVPLVLKSMVLKNASLQAEYRASATFSNLGHIKMPPELLPHIRLFSVFSSASALFMGVCSFADILTISFSSPLVASGVQRAFFRAISGFGIAVELVSNRAEL